jgi:hypothetical protein
LLRHAAVLTLPPGAAASARKTMASGNWKLDSASYFLKFTPGLVRCPCLRCLPRQLLAMESFGHLAGCQSGRADAVASVATALLATPRLPPAAAGLVQRAPIGHLSSLW